MRDTAIRNTHASVVVIDGDTDAWDANGDVVVLDESAITTEVTRLQTIYDGQEYARKRKAKYDALNQFELISDDAINGTTTHKDAIVAIKSEFPKP
tara:strand:- start:107 stop:394 length:288 start_codon:yes stop_codon:yes gene_type:complete